MQSFGELLQIFRGRCLDPVQGRPLTQIRIGELLGDELGGAGYAGASVSNWERNKSKINEDDRLVLLSLIRVLYKCGGLEGPEEADRLLSSGNYRALDINERGQIFLHPVEKEPDDSDSSRTTAWEGVSPERNKELILLEKVKRFWVQGILEPSVQDAMLIDLGRTRFDHAVEQPWRDVVGPAVYVYEEETAGTPLDLFRDADNALLILGDTGAGKTTTMLQLVNELITMAEVDPTQPIPVVLNLVSWKKWESIADWVVDDLTAKYQIPRRLGRAWLEDHKLALFLDGFDEVAAEHLCACALAINHFRETHGLTSLIICSRTEAYEQCAVRLRLGGAILLHPLTPSQADAYLAAAGPRLSALRTIVQQESSWQEMAQSPLTLSVMRVTYGDADIGELFKDSDLGADGSVAAHRLLFDAYTRRMLRGRSQNPPYSSKRTRKWLAWLSHEMGRHNHTLFLVEQLQPSWLPSRFWRWLYLLGTWLATGLYVGILMWLFLQLLRQIVPWPATTPGLMANILELPINQAEILAILLSSMLLGLLVGIIHGFYFESRLDPVDEIGASGRQGWGQIATVGLSVGLVTILFFAPTGDPGLALSWSITEAFLFMVISRYSHGRSYSSEIRTVEALSWSWPSAAKGLVYGLVLGALAEIIETWLFGYNGILRTVFTFGPAGMLLGGLRGSRVETKSRPNEGIRLSLKNAVIAGLLSGLLIGFLAGILRLDPVRGLITGLLLALFALPLYGASNVTKHYYVRMLLAYEGLIPWRFIHFLDYAARVVLLRQVGGSYIFVHRLLQDYFGYQEESGMKAPLTIGDQGDQ